MSKKLEKGYSSEKKKMYFELFPLKVWTALWIVNTYFEFQVSIFSLTEILQDVRVFARQCRYQSYNSTLGFLRKQPS